MPALATVCVLLLERVALACSGSDCTPPIAAPQDGTVMPINAAGVRWEASTSEADDVVLRDIAANVTLPIAFEQTGSLFDLRPATPLDPGKTYRFEFPDDLCGPAFNRSFVTAPAVELSTSSLGSLVAAPPELAQIEIPASVTCSASVDAVRVDVELELDPQLEPFAGVLMYETLVDGKRWHHEPQLFASPKLGESWVGRGVDSIFSTCPDGSWNGVSPGPHQVQMRAEIPGLPGVVLESDVIEIVLECATTGETGDDESESDESESGSFAAPIDESEGSQGCSCSSDGGRWPAALTAPVVLLLAWSRHRRS
ncbi:MAG TPA: MYXO-CTERM sorting domain-containing protein [Enhygromyxa sp.]|nr:MYXO-CTERM sorting domain-containing protein [Enhygromyxa sp.]